MKRLMLAWLGMLAGCRHGGRAQAAPVYDFDESLVQGNVTQDGCTYTRTPLTMADRVPHLNRRVSDLVQDASRSWVSTLAWCEGSLGSAPTTVTWSFGDVASVELVRPRRDPEADGHAEMGCRLTVDLGGKLRVHTDDGRWSAVMPATLEIEQGDFSARITGQPAQIVALPWASSIDPGGHAWLMSWLAPHGASVAAGEIQAQDRAGKYLLVAQWWEPGHDAGSRCPAGERVPEESAGP